MIKKSCDRVFGLDILRSIAIILVVFSHSTALLSNQINSYLTFPLPDGVDLFFVLSGYLVGLILIKTVERNDGINLLLMINFLIRRWFRTLPNYFLFLLINIVLIYFSLIPGELNKYLITYFVFFQNFHKPYDFLFWESWSLSVEEWFYIFYPFILVFTFWVRGGEKGGGRKKMILISIFVLLILPLLYRIIESTPSMDTDAYFRKLVLTRLDSIGFGVLASYISFYNNYFWKKHKNTFFLIGSLSMVFLLNLNEASVFFNQTFIFTIKSLSIALLLPKLSSIECERIKFKPFQFISKISYSIYLVHLPLFFLIKKSSFFDGSLILYVFYWVLTILISNLIYVFFEKPIMNYRDRISL